MNENGINSKDDNILASIVPLEEALPRELFIIPLKARPVFPGIITPLVIPPGRFVPSVEESLQKDRYLGLVCLKKDDSPEDSENNIYHVGVVCRIIKKINLPDGGVNILVNTIRRLKIEKIVSTHPHLKAIVNYPEEEYGTSKNTIKAMMRTLIILTKELAQNNPLFTEEMKLTMMNMDEPGKMADFVCSILNLEKEDYQSVIESFDIGDRIEKVLLYLKKEIELVNLQRKIQEQINEKIDKQQRQYYLREQLKAIQNELGIQNEKGIRKYDDLVLRLKENQIDEQVVSEVEREVEKFHATDPNSPEYNITRNYLEILSALPWEVPQKKEIDISKARKILDRDHYKLDDVKERILEFLAVRKLNPTGKGPILCLVGPPGVGKTSIARSIAEATNRKFFRFSVGGMRDEAEIKGHRRTYIGAMPGKVINALRITKAKDPVILLDELDKISVGFQGDPASALLEVLDPEQNSAFRDHYIDLPFDLSHVFFIATANTTETIPRVLLDRMEVINLSGYITDEKVQIFRKYLWKKTLINNGYEKYAPSWDLKAIPLFINSYSRESGLRGLEKMTDKIVRKLALKTLENQKIPKIIDYSYVKELLGPPPFVDDRMTVPKIPGTALGLAWTSSGGSTLLLEAVAVRTKSEPKIVLTGQLGKMMEESAKIALSYVRTVFSDLDFFENHSIHLHAPDGATPKDGPSAGITIATAIVSLVTGKVMKKGYAMTGEITLTGEVLSIGGLREKIVAAKRSSIKNIIIPEDNKSQLEEIPDYVKKGVEFHFVSSYRQVGELVFGKNWNQKTN